MKLAQRWLDSVIVRNINPNINPILTPNASSTMKTWTRPKWVQQPVVASAYSAKSYVVWCTAMVTTRIHTRKVLTCWRTWWSNLSPKWHTGRCLFFPIARYMTKYVTKYWINVPFFRRAMEIGRTGRVQVEDIIFLVRKDQRKYARVKDLLTMNEELKRARKAFDEIKYVGSEGKQKWFNVHSILKIYEHIILISYLIISLNKYMI